MFLKKKLKKKTSFVIERTKWLRNIKTYLIELWQQIVNQQIKYYDNNHKIMHFLKKKNTIAKQKYTHV